MLDNKQRRNILDNAKAANYQGSIIDLFRQAEQGADISQIINPPQQEMLTAQTPQEQEVGLREQHAQGNTGASMAFPDVPPNTAFNTKGMKVPIDITKYDQQGHLVQSFKNVPPGIESLPTGPEQGTIIETPSYQKGGKKLTYAEWRDTLPPNLKDTDTTTYNLRGAYQAGLQPLDHEDGTKHLSSINPNTLEFLKSSDHKTVQKEIEWFNSQGKDAPFGPHTHKIVKDPSGYFKDKQLKYVPRKSNK
jgi:uncharacterized membrane protein (UPF0127 family)